MEDEKRQLQVRVMGACKRSARYAKKWAGMTGEWCEMGHSTVLHTNDCPCEKGVCLFKEFSLEGIVNSRERVPMLYYYLS